MHKQGQHLTEVIFEFKSSNVTLCDTECFLNALIIEIQVEETSRFVNTLPPGFDVLCGLKESCIYFGCWPEYSYNRLIVSSCKQFKYDKIVSLIEAYFKVIDRICIKVNSDESIQQKVKRLWM
jgi:S-adenosylmethionine/arginine decarboxylase-like enzyme